MSHGNWFEAMTNAATDLQYGFSLLNIVTEIRTTGKFAGNRVLKKLAPRDQKSIYAWIWDAKFRELQGFIQKPQLEQTRKFNPTHSGSFAENGLNLVTANRLATNKWPFIKSGQLLHFKYNSTNNNPQGDSPLMHCYSAWQEGLLVKRYEILGVSKDLGGLVILRVPSELIERAADPENYPLEAQEYTNLQADAAALQAGESTYIVLTSDKDEVTKGNLYDLDLKGIDGGGKQYSTDLIIDQKKKSIYSVFGTSYLLLGQDSVGSYALSTTGTSTHGFYVSRNIAQKVVVIENQLAPQLLRSNNIFLDFEDMPEFKPADPTELDLETASKFIQRVGSVEKLTPAALEFIFEKSGLPIDNISDLDFTSKGESRASEGKGTSGTGGSQSGGKNSSTNMENKSIENFVFDSENKSELVLLNVKSGESAILDKD